MTYYPQCAAEEEDGPQFNPILSNHVFPEKLSRLREAGRKMTVLNKLSRETAKFHEEQARRHGVNTPRGLMHFRASKAFTEGNNKLMEFFNQGQGGEQGQSGLDPKAEKQAHLNSIKFHKKAAEKAGLDTDEGHAHVGIMEKHMDMLNHAKKKSALVQQQKKQQQSAAGEKGRRVPFTGVPKKSEIKNPDIHQNKPPIKLKPSDANKEAKGKSNKYVAPRYDKSHPEGFKKTYDGMEA